MITQIMDASAAHLQIQDLSSDEVDSVDGAMANLVGRGVTAALVLVGCGTGVALVAGVAVGLAVAYYEIHK